ncbi:MAG TPA: Na/Pi cotransporter family protein [Acetobacteraceae bacterium]|nr:Na/Pi cotransporter family protein [Acetobacteraceae bacterium]
MTWTLLDLAGSVALLLWGVHMVQTGIQRAFGPELRRGLGRALHNRLAAFAAGLGVTAILQSSTATGLMVAGFAAGGAVALQPALAVMLGANVGTTLIVQAFSFNVAGVAPALILLGVLLFRRSGSTRTRDLGRVAIGLGLMLMALARLVTLVTPYEDAPSLRLVLGAVATQPMLDVLLAAGLTWMAHSSVAVVLLIMSFAARGAVPPEAAFALVLGANLGTAINPVLEGVSGDDPVARRLPIGNLLNRLLGVVVALALLPRMAPLWVAIDPDPVREVADFHTAFNLLLAVVFLPLLGPWASLLRQMLPARVEPDDPGRPRYLEQAALETPPIALAGAAREALRMADALEIMLTGAADALTGSNRQRIAEVRRLDDVLDRLNNAIRAYLTSLDADALTEADDRRLSEVLVFVTNLEAAGDVVDRAVMGYVARRVKRGVPLPVAEQAEASKVLHRLAGTVRAAAAVFMTEDARAARLLVAEKEAFREIESAATAAHFAGLRGTAGPAEAGALNLDLLRELKRVNSHLVAAAAYPVLEGQGELLPSRLRAEP